MTCIGEYTVSELASWVLGSEYRKRVIISFIQPLTALQISRRTNLARPTCSYSLCQLCGREIVRCLNPQASASRLYWLTQEGMNCQTNVAESVGITIKTTFPEIDWKLYGMLCFRHRGAVVRTLRAPMQPVHIRKRAVYDNPEIRMSANNVRDVMRFLKANQIVRPVKVRRKKHLHYELTEHGKQARELLIRAEDAS